tara:strand:- start:859 stop:1170 length:312 start_codon:yes stop_codon:yes gene_type:complete
VPNALHFKSNTIPEIDPGKTETPLSIRIHSWDLGTDEWAGRGVNHFEGLPPKLEKRNSAHPLQEGIEKLKPSPYSRHTTAERLPSHQDDELVVFSSFNGSAKP